MTLMTWNDKKSTWSLQTVWIFTSYFACFSLLNLCRLISSVCVWVIFGLQLHLCVVLAGLLLTNSSFGVWVLIFLLPNVKCINNINSCSIFINSCYYGIGDNWLDITPQDLDQMLSDYATTANNGSRAGSNTDPGFDLNKVCTANQKYGCKRLNLWGAFCQMPSFSWARGPNLPTGSMPPPLKEF